MQKYRSCKYLAIGSLLDPVTHPLHERTARQDSSCRRMFETEFLSPQLSIKSIMIAASAAEMTAIPIVPNSHFLPLSLAVM